MKSIGIYPGNFQPPTKAHLQVYKRLRQIVGPDTFIATTDRTPTPEAPLNIGDKEQILVRHGIPSSNIQRIQDWKHPEEIFHKFSSDHTAVIFALNQKETDEVAKRKSSASQLKGTPKINELAITPGNDPVEKEVWMEGGGKLNYFQPYRGNENSMKPFSKHGYVMVIDDSKINGQPISTANIRKIFGSSQYTEKVKKRFFRYIFGWFDVGLYTLISSKFRLAHNDVSDEEPIISPEEVPSIETPPTTINKGKVKPMSVPPVKSPSFKENITKLVHEILEEIMNEDYSSTMSSTTDSSAGSASDMASALDKQSNPSQQRADDAKTRLALNKDKQLAVKDLDTMKKDVKWKEADLRTKRTITLKQQQDKIDALNKQIANPESNSTDVSSVGLN